MFMPVKDFLEKFASTGCSFIVKSGPFAFHLTADELINGEPGPDSAPDLRDEDISEWGLGEGALVIILKNEELRPGLKFPTIAIGEKVVIDWESFSNQYELTEAYQQFRAENGDDAQFVVFGILCNEDSFYSGNYRYKLGRETEAEFIVPSDVLVWASEYHPPVYKDDEPEEQPDEAEEPEAPESSEPNEFEPPVFPGQEN